MDAPTLHEIAAMPFSEAQATVRKFYDANWGTGAAGLRTYEVDVSYEVTKTERRYLRVEAFCEAEAVVKAKDRAREIEKDSELYYIEAGKPREVREP